jgi:hypothetical protein
MTAPDLGPLPETNWTLAVEGDGYSPDRLLREAAYDADQMRAYALQEVAKERERWAYKCDEVAAILRKSTQEKKQISAMMAEWLAAEIRKG